VARPAWWASRLIEAGTAEPFGLYGEDNTAILTGLLGMSEEEVAELTAQGVL
jgi:crotonobetainyl-CoA:carnitine CoA-transferase CaiB-like acyl-CoA transferase